MNKQNKKNQAEEKSQQLKGYKATMHEARSMITPWYGVESTDTGQENSGEEEFPSSEKGAPHIVLDIPKIAIGDCVMKG